jgi:hypothetical protein
MASFRQTTDTLSQLVVYEASRSLATERIEINTPMGPTAGVRIVYTLGMLPRSDTHQWCRLLSEFHSDEEVQQTLAGIRASAQQHLRGKPLRTVSAMNQNNPS